jgi:hypothetical protein
MTSTAPRTFTWHRAQVDAIDLRPVPVPHDMACAYCGHALHVPLSCGDRCACGPQIMPGTTA